MDFYFYNKCGTCRKAKKYLDDNNIPYNPIDITLNPPPKKTLKLALTQKGMKKLFNTSGVEYKERKIKDKIKTMKESEALDMLASCGRLIKRPIAVEGDRVTVGYDAEEFASTWG